MTRKEVNKNNIPNFLVDVTFTNFPLNKVNPKVFIKKSRC